MKLRKLMTLGLFASLFLSINLSAQEKELYIIYKLFDPSINSSDSLEVRASGDVCLSTRIRKIMMGASINVNRKTGEITRDPSAVGFNYSFYHDFKNYATGKMINCESFSSVELFVEEDMNLFDWKITDKTDTILGYQCKLAKAHFRGRIYAAWFTTQLPYKAAPWKFHALPGVVLKVSSNDQFYKAEAQQVVLRNQVEVIKNPYTNQTKNSREDFLKEYKKKHKAHVSNMKTMYAKMNQELPKMLLKSPRAEVILEDVNREIPEHLKER